MQAFVKGIAIAGVMGLGACGSNQLMNIETGQNSPDEFAILPTRALSMPPDLALLPAPTPGGANITDPNPNADAVAALGGNPAIGSRTAVAFSNPDCAFDIQARLADGKYAIFTGVNLCDVTVVTLNRGAGGQLWVDYD